LKRKIDTRAVGLDVGLSLVRWLTGGDHLHYGLWDDLEPYAGNLRRAQEAYTRNLTSHFPDGKLRILDIGGGAGATARQLLDLGHDVEIVVPSPLLAARCRELAPEATTHEVGFEDFDGAGPFDLCLFSESFQYVPLNVGLARAARLLQPGGHVVIADCFRSESFQPGSRVVGGGHRIAGFRETLAGLPFEVVAEQDLTSRVAPSIDIEQGLFAAIGDVVRRLDQELAEKRPATRWAIRTGFGLAVSRRRRADIRRRLFERTRTSAEFVENNRYLLLKLRRT
jgi:SAM-dependent methyltransferase